MNNLPPARSRRWLVWFVWYGFMMAGVMWLTRFVIWKNEFDPGLALRLLLFSLVAAVVVNGLGWLGLRWFWLLSTIGLALGLVAMIRSAYLGMDGFRDLAGFLYFLLLSAAGIALGLLAEIVRYIRIRLREKG
ncbi:hypothetical protein [Paenibacillus sp. YN15]|uniref:hypothetical protein n=1 Tax=Paenibacillus sp. YN15 TaxID=1742774 RepID=UPI000DCE9E50|nr:hypothetical protein [Paenibacillus sp. YN15]RAU92835.1 hypothetical protein DQG13_26845 [Paenibacillus sp. YN15]